MDLRESPAQPHHHHHHLHHSHQPPPGMMMPLPPPQHQLHNNASYMPNNNAQQMITSNSVPSPMQNPRFPFNSVNPQYVDGSSQSSGMPTGGFSVEPARKKRGRPRKYSPDGNNNNIALGLATSPVTPTVDSSGGAVAHSSEPNSSKKGRGRPPSSGKKQLDALGEPGVGFTPHVIICKSGEDIASIIRSFSQQGPRSVCILSANGAVSKLTLRQPAMSAGAITYEGKFEIISLTGNFSAADRSGNLSVSLAGSDGRVLGGTVAGVLMAATPVQVIVGSFAPSTKRKQASNDSGTISLTQQAANMMNFGGPVAGSSPRSDGEASSESSEESDNSPFNRGGPPEGNNSQGQGQGMQQNMYNMGWPNNNTMNMLPN